MAAHHSLWMLSDAKSILGQKKRFTKALKPVHRRLFGVLAEQTEKMTSDNTLPLVAFSLVFSRSRAGRGKGSSSDISCNIICPRAQLTASLSLTHCQGQSHCLAPLLLSAFANCSGPSSEHNLEFLQLLQYSYFGFMI